MSELCELVTHHVKGEGVWAPLWVGAGTLQIIWQIVMQWVNIALLDISYFIFPRNLIAVFILYTSPFSFFNRITSSNKCFDFSFYNPNSQELLNSLPPQAKRK